MWPLFNSGSTVVTKPRMIKLVACFISKLRYVEKIGKKSRQKSRKKARKTGMKGVVPIPFPSPYFFQIPLTHKRFLNWSRLKGFKNIYPLPILTFFPHSQCPNPSPSALNPIFPGQQKTNPSSILPVQDPQEKSITRFAWH